MRTSRLAVLILPVVLLGCEEEPLRTYAAPKPAAPAAQTVADPVAPPAHDHVHVGWELPEGWRQVENAQSMRFATIHAGDAAQPLEISVTHLPGSAGGIIANVNRWRGQLGLPPAESGELTSEMDAFDSEGAHGVVMLIDGSASSDAALQQLGILAAIITMEDRMWFLKATAPLEQLREHREGFEQFARSMRPMSHEEAHAQ